jgi:hypothetical protein
MDARTPLATTIERDSLPACQPDGPAADLRLYAGAFCAGRRRRPIVSVAFAADPQAEFRLVTDCSD